MQTVAADTAKKTAQSGQNGTLDQRYHQIGISAVAAAVRYQGETKNPAYAPVPTNWDDYPPEAA
jgi:hypothetical protein